MLAATPVPAIGFSPADVLIIIVPLDCTAPALVHRMVWAQFLATFALLAAAIVESTPHDIGD